MIARSFTGAVKDNTASLSTTTSAAGVAAVSLPTSSCAFQATRPTSAYVMHDSCPVSHLTTTTLAPTLVSSLSFVRIVFRVHIVLCLSLVAGFFYCFYYKLCRVDNCLNGHVSADCQVYV